tara:strand:- start:1951 stop:2520 length:570 start_codon:yes stop_codon:yes gene_type:complete
MIHSKLIPNAQYNDALRGEKYGGLELASMEQTHSDICLEINKPGIYYADALITKQRKLMLVVKTADCMPVLITDGEKVGVVHIGWKGIENDIFYKTISNFNLNKLKVSIGPHAQKCCYEVSEDLESKFSKLCLKQENKIYLDLSKGIKDFCYENKVDVEVSDVCTIENKKYYSYRRNKTKKRQISTLWI